MLKSEKVESLQSCKFTLQPDQLPVNYYKLSKKVLPGKITTPQELNIGLQFGSKTKS